ncbi:hypothetical protein GGI25_000711 [Coemansia spiralis]|uniref:Transcriptional regulatory protein n=2 Tax=Coemansia TaxID=4863 RepID=A0A9W8GBT4_9FUNG|nr:DNA-binding regulatory protein, YebC/PmpR family [Coemansia spiralis]KAJ1995734.1 hypothetical protein EDC05_000668 [Coemansia umbellata]KAJ2680419.1 hypothetical protein GGI25_000711 [Coemansia spiralis]
MSCDKAQTELAALFAYSQKRSAGHSRWAKIRHSKGASDIKKGQVFSSITKDIFTAVRESGPDAKFNLRLAAAIRQARHVEMPKENIERAIKRAASKEFSDAEQVVYEGLGPHGVAMIIECLTDNKNRTVKALRSKFNRFGGSMAPVGYMFDKKGRIWLAQGSSLDSVDVMLENAIEAGAEDIADLENKIEIICEFSKLQYIAKSLSESRGYVVELIEGTYIPNTLADVSEDSTNEIEEITESIEELDDVIKVHCNLP